MSYEVLEQKLKCIPDEYTEMVLSMLDSVIRIINLQNASSANIATTKTNDKLFLKTSEIDEQQ